MLLSKRQARWGIAGGLMFCMCAWSGWAGEAVVTGTAFGPMLAAGNNRVLILSPSGQVLWQYPAGLVHDVWMLPNGNVLFADGISVTEVTPDKTVVFQYPGKVAFAAIRTPKQTKITREKTVVWSYAKPDGDSSMVGVELLSSDGNPLAALSLR